MSRVKNTGERKNSSVRGRFEGPAPQGQRDADDAESDAVDAEGHNERRHHQQAAWHRDLREQGGIFRHGVDRAVEPFGERSPRPQRCNEEGHGVRRTFAGG
jgi:hypothetical protein